MADIVQTDVLILGAGLVGLSTALVLAQQGFAVTLLDKKPVGAAHSGKERPLSLNYGSMCLLNTLGVWGALQRHAVSIEMVHISEANVFGALHFAAHQLKVPALGYVVSSIRLEGLLAQQVLAHPMIRFMVLDTIEQLEASEQGAKIRFHHNDSETTLHAQLLVGADGTDSDVRKWFSFDVEAQSSVEKISVVGRCLFADVPKARHTAYQRFTSDGVLATLPSLDQQSYPIVCTMPFSSWESQQNWDEQDWCAFLNRVWRGRLPHLVSYEQGASFPLKTVLAKTSIKPGVVLLGNAAHTIYPLAAQGFNLGLRDVATLVDVLKEARMSRHALGAFSVLQTYANWREPEQEAMIALTRRVSEWFGLMGKGFSAVRGIGLLGMDLCMPFKKRVATEAMGLAGRLPSLLQLNEYERDYL